jgi:hypothetical protein
MGAGAMLGRSAQQISYRKAVDVLAGYLRMYEQFQQPEVAQRTAETVLAGALPERQRERLRETQR